MAVVIIMFSSFPTNGKIRVKMKNNQPLQTESNGEIQLTALLRRELSPMPVALSVVKRFQLEPRPQTIDDKIGKYHLSFLPTESLTFADSDYNYSEDFKPSLSPGQSFITKVCDRTQILTDKTGCQFHDLTPVNPPCGGNPQLSPLTINRTFFIAKITPAITTPKTPIHSAEATGCRGKVAT
jgi:hypothetical protein